MPKPLVDPRFKLRHGPYVPPPLRRGDRATCLVRDCDVIITSWTSAPIPWPRCCPIGQRGGSGILVDETLARAIRMESAAAVRHWWGVGISTMAWWRRSLGVTSKNNPSTRMLLRCAAEAGGQATRERGVTAEEREQRRQNERRHNLRRHLRPAGGRPLWTGEQLLLLGTIPDAEVARRLGKTQNAVRLKREGLRIPNPEDRRRREHRKG